MWRLLRPLRWATSPCGRGCLGARPIYVALIASVGLREEPLRARLFGGAVLALCGLVVAFSESVALGDSRLAVVATVACVVAPLGGANRQRDDEAARRRRRCVG